MRFPEPVVPHSELTEQIIASGYAVHSDLGPGLSEKIYENALCVEFAYRNIHFNQQQEFPVHYRDKFVGKLIPDLVVESKVIIDAKIVEDLNSAHIAQLLSYLKITKLEVGLLLNFKPSSMKIKRVTNFQS